MTAGITILLQQDASGRMSVNHVITGDVPLLVAANACRATADAIDRERIRGEELAKIKAEQQEGDTDD